MTSHDDYFENLPPEEQEKLDRIAQRSVLALPRYPRDMDVVLELLAWQHLEGDVLEAHSAWLERTKAWFERRGIEWTVDNLNSFPRLREERE